MASTATVAPTVHEPDLNARPEESVPTMALLRAAIEVSMERAREPLVLAISGGRDSMALMHAVARWAPSRLAAVATFDHGTGGYATEAAALVAADARRLGLTVVRERARTPLRSEAEWRQARWQFLHRVAKAYGARVATAHTRDDQVETIVMRLLRGAGARGVAALAAPSRVVRPWLPIARAEVAAWATAESVPYLEDPMNASRYFQRGRVRHDLLPALESAHPGFSEDMLALGERAAAWRRDVEAYLDAQSLESPRQHVLQANADMFERTTDEGRAILWSACFARLGVTLDARGTHTLVRFSKTLRRGAHVMVAGGAVALRVGTASGDRFELRAASGAAITEPAEWSGAAEHVPLRWGRWRFRRLSALDAQKAAADPWLFGVPMRASVSLRAWCAGDRIETPGSPAGRRVSRYFSDARIPALDRSGWPVVLVDRALWCVPGMCRSLAAPHRPGWPDSIWYRCEREFD